MNEPKDDKPKQPEQPVEIEVPVKTDADDETSEAEGAEGDPAQAGEATQAAQAGQEEEAGEEGEAGEPPPKGKLTLLKEFLQPYLLSAWQKSAPFIMPIVETLWKYTKRISLWVWQSRIGDFARRFWAWFIQTRIGAWLWAKVLSYWAYVKQKYAEVLTIYHKLTSPPPDPLMAAMMMKDEPIDIDDDDIKLTGNKVFIYITSFFVILVLWATFTELDEVVRADGAVVPPSSVQQVQNRLPGSLVSIKIKLGDHVEKGEVLFELEDDDVIANFDDNEITRIASFAMKARLEAEADGLDEVAFPEWLEKKAPEEVKSERAVFARRQKALNSRLIAIKRRIKNFEDRIEIIKPLVEAGHEARLALVDVEGQYNQAVDEYEAIIASFRAESAAQLAEVKTQADQAVAREDAFRAKVNYAKVRSPTSGTVSAVNVKTVGAVLQAGTLLAEIVPDEQSVLIRARLLAEDVSSVYVGQVAQISLSTYDVSRYGTLEGRVQRIAQNTTQEENFPPYYATMVEVPNPRFSKSTQDVEVVPGTPTVIDIIGKKRTVLSYILTPLNRASSIAFREQ